MRKARVDEIFEEGESGNIRISQEAPQVLLDAFYQAEDEVERGSDFAVVDIGKYQRPLEYGTGELRVVQASSATIFTRKEADGRIKMISVGVSPDGPLSQDQIDRVLMDTGEEARLSPEEMAESKAFSVAIRSIKQSKVFVDTNSNRLLLSIAKLQQKLDEIVEDRESVREIAEEVEVDLHNVLSSVYTFHEAANSSLSNLGVSRKYRYLTHRYQDSIAPAIGLRHCVQHNTTLRVQWIGRYSHQSEMFDFDIGIPLEEVKKSELYTKSHYHDVSGEKYTPIEYFYSDIDGRAILLEDLLSTIQNATEETYQTLKSNLEQDDEVVNTNIEKLWKVKGFYIESWHKGNSK